MPDSWKKFPVFIRMALPYEELTGPWTRVQWLQQPVTEAPSANQKSDSAKSQNQAASGQQVWSGSTFEKVTDMSFISSHQWPSGALRWEAGEGQRRRQEAAVSVWRRGSWVPHCSKALLNHWHFSDLVYSHPNTGDPLRKGGGKRQAQQSLQEGDFKCQPLKSQNLGMDVL